MPDLQLYSASLSMFGMKVEIALREKAVDLELIQVPFDNAIGYEPKHPEVVRINPKRQVPVLIHQGLELYDSTQIFEYLEEAFPEPPLWPRTLADRARARQMEHAADEVFFPHVVRLMGLQDDLQGEAASTARLAAEAYYAQMEAQLADRAWLAGDYGFADIAFFMAQIFGERLGAPLTEATPRLIAWRQAILQRPAVRPVMQRLADYLTVEGRFVPACSGCRRKSIGLYIRARYNSVMINHARLTPEEIETARQRRLEAMRSQEIEGNPLDADDIAMFEMFEREGWSHERRRAYILAMLNPVS